MNEYISIVFLIRFFLRPDVLDKMGDFTDLTFIFSSGKIITMEKI